MLVAGFPSCRGVHKTKEKKKQKNQTKPNTKRKTNEASGRSLQGKLQIIPNGNDEGLEQRKTDRAKKEKSRSFRFRRVISTLQDEFLYISRCMFLHFQNQNKTKKLK
jgi:hypothetical protein